MSQSTHPLTVEDILGIKNVHDARISPDGAHIAFVVSDVTKLDTKRPKSRIWLVGTDGAPARPFTLGPRTDECPRWSPEGSHLAFLSDRLEDGKLQVFLLSVDGGEAEPLTHFEGNVLNLEWSRDGHSIFCLMEDPETPAEKKRKETKDDAIEFECRPKYARVWHLDLASRSCRVITEGGVHIWEFEVSPDGRELVLLASTAPSEFEWYRPHLAFVPASGGLPRKFYTPAQNRQIAMPRYSPAGEQIAFITCLWSDRGYVAGDLCTIDRTGGTFRNLTRGTPRDISSFEWSSDGQDLLVIGYDHGNSMIGTVSLNSGTFTGLWSNGAAFADRGWQHFTRSRDGSCIAVTREDASNPPDIWLAKRQGAALDWTQLTNINPQAADIQLGESSMMHWTSTDGRQVQGFVIKPVGYQEGQRYPMVTWVHGGPAGNYGPRYYVLGSRAQWLASHGYMVFLPNPRGSLGWGTEFTESNVGDMGGMDWQDIMTGVDACVARGWADENRLGLAGWSYGGFMTAWGITQTNRFKAAMMGAGISNWLSFHGVSNLCHWDAIANNASPFERGGVYDRFSPMTYVTRVTTPTLILHGEADPYVPVGQAYEEYRALKDSGVPVQLVVYPREGHGFTEQAHFVDMVKRIDEWFDRYLK